MQGLQHGAAVPGSRMFGTGAAETAYLAAAIGFIGILVATIHLLLYILTPIPIPTASSERLYTTTPDSKAESLPSLMDEPSLGLSVIIPAYNEDDRLAIMVDEAMSYLLDTLDAPEGISPRTDVKEQEANGNVQTNGQHTMRQRILEEGVELIVVDDGSTDGTTRTAQKLAEKWVDVVNKRRKGKGVDCDQSGGGSVELRVVTLRRNRGKGGAVQHGMCHSRGRLLLFADADGASRFSDLDLLLAAMDTISDKDDHGIVVGSRAHLVKSDAVVKRSFLRNALMHGFHLFLRTLGVDGIRDTQCGFKLFTRQTARLLFPSLHLPRWSFDVELLLLASLVKPPVPVLEVPIAWHEVNGSKIRLGWDSLGMARDLLLLRGNLSVGRWEVPRRSEIRSLGGVGQAKAAASSHAENPVGTR